MENKKMDSNYSVTIVESSRSLTRRESVKLGSVTGMTALKTATDGDKTITIVNPKLWAVIHIHNDRAKTNADGSRSTDYDNVVILDENGDGYYTGSNSFMEEIRRIWAEMADDDGNPAEDFNVKVYQRKSANFPGNFVTCSIE